MRMLAGEKEPGVLSDDDDVRMIRPAEKGPSVQMGADGPCMIPLGKEPCVLLGDADVCLLVGERVLYVLLGDKGMCMIP